MFRRKRVTTVVIVGLIGLVCIVLLVLLNSQDFNDYVLLNRRDSPYRTAVAFMTALRLNDPAAYEIAHPDLTSRLDEWMSTHEVRDCARQSNGIVGGGSLQSGFGLIYRCITREGKDYRFEVKDIYLSDPQTVVDWSGVVEE